MATFVIETYLSRARGGELEGAAARLREAIDQAARGGAADRAPRLIRSFYVADDEIAYYIVEADTEDGARALARNAGILPERIVSASSPRGSRAG